MAGGGHGELFVCDYCFTVDLCCNRRAVGVDDVDALEVVNRLVDLFAELLGVACGNGSLGVEPAHGAEAEVLTVVDCGGNVCEGLSVLGLGVHGR